MDKTIEELIDEKTKVVLNLIRTNLNEDQALKITQAVVNMSNAKQLQQGKSIRTKGAGS